MSKFVRKPLAWGTSFTHDVSDCKTSGEVMEKAGLNWDVDKCELVAEMPFGINRDNSIKTASGEFAHDGNIYRRCPNAYGTYRVDNNRPLGVVKQKYEVVQNRDAFAFFDSVVGSGQAIWDRAGYFGDGEKIVVTAKLPGIIKAPGGDIDKYLVFANSHDGSCSVNIMFTPVRVVCTNLLNSAFESADSYIRIRHTVSAGARLDIGAQILQDTIKKAKTAEEIYQSLNNIKMTDDNVKDYLCRIILSEAEYVNLINFDPKNGFKKLINRDYYCKEETGISMRKINQISQMYEYYMGGFGQKEIMGTAWGAYNAVTGYYCNVANLEGQKRTESLLWGSANKSMNNALHFAYVDLEAA